MKSTHTKIKEEVIVSNMNNATVEFYEFNGDLTMTLPNDVLPNEEGQTGPINYNKPALATMLMGKIISVSWKQITIKI